MSRRRPISEEEAALWRAVTLKVKPLRRHRQNRPVTDPEASPKAKPAARSPGSSRSSVIKVPKTAPAREAPPLASLDRRTKQRLARGTAEIGGRLDLHGRSQAEAHAALQRFLMRAQADGAATVLVITGKGGGEGERGVLRRQVPLWLALPEFRSLVIGYGPAATGHGGDGALYVRVRRPRS